LEHECFNQLTVKVSFTKDYMDGKLADHLGYTVPWDCGFARTLASVRMRDRKQTLHKNVPIHYLRPIHPTGEGGKVVVITEPHRGEVYSVKALANGMCFLTLPDSSDVVLEYLPKSLAALFVN
jgi:putative transposon-encoded protein